MSLFGNDYSKKENWVMCPRCFYSGKIKCPSCGGTGLEYPSNSKSGPCSQCNGTGKIQCYNCAGFGKVKK